MSLWRREMANLDRLGPYLVLDVLLTSRILPRMGDPVGQAGWYPDPRDPRWVVYWNGNNWTGDRQPVPSPARQTRPKALYWGLALVVMGGLFIAVVGKATHGFRNMAAYNSGYQSVAEYPLSTKKLYAAGGLDRFGICFAQSQVAKIDYFESRSKYDDFMEGCYDGLDEVLGPGPHGIG